MKAKKENIDIDIEVVNRPLTIKEKQSFSEFLLKRKKRKERKFTNEITIGNHVIQ